MSTPVLLGKVPEGTEARPGDPILPREWLAEKPHGSRTYLLLTPGITSSTIKMAIQGGLRELSHASLTTGDGFVGISKRRAFSPLFRSIRKQDVHFSGNRARVPNSLMN